jgi:two-component system, OmpR family, phosphate regulon sensor histidine kinase PhoR
LLELVRSYELDQLIEQSRNSQQPAQKDWTFYPVSADPSQLYYKQASALRGKAIPLHNGQVGIFIESRQEAVSLKQQRDRWASDVAHELKTPLTSIRLVSETLQSRLEDPLRGWADRLINEAVRLSNLVQDLLDLSQIDRNIPHCLKFTQTNLPDLVQAAWLSLEPLAGKKQIRLEYDGPKEFCVELDEQRIYRVLINLFDNAIKYSPPRQQICVEISQNTLPDAPPDQEPQMVCLSVIDAGPGFTEQALPHVFERFYRADPSRSQQGSPFPQMGASTSTSAVESHSVDLQHRSSGLGLSIVQQIVEAHGGLVAASNHPDTGGAWLQVWLPIRQDSANL